MTATIIESELDTGSIEALDFSHVPACEGGNQETGEDCGNEAEFQCLLTCCGSILLLCEDCVFHWKEFWAAECTEWSFRCGFCKTEHIGHDPVKVVGRI